MAASKAEASALQSPPPACPRDYLRGLRGQLLKTATVDFCCAWRGSVEELIPLTTVSAVQRVRREKCATQIDIFPLQKLLRGGLFMIS
jgi:hypothetical protein